MSTRFLQRARREEMGTFIVLMALSLLVVFGFAALSIDIGHVYQQKRDMQSATDAAAMAGAALLTNSSPSQTAIIQAAQTIALSNGISLAEITAATSDDGTIEVGTWNTNNTPPFTANTASSTWNAVRVPAKRTVGLFFGKVIVLGGGLTAMNPSVRTVAALTGLGSVYGAVNFGIGQSDLGTATFGSIIDLTSTGSGDTGALNFHGQMGGDPANWVDAFVNGYSGTISVNDTDDTTRPGIPKKVSGAFDTRIQNGDTIVVMPVIQDPTQSNKPVKILGFVEVQLLPGTGGGVGNWSGQVKFLHTVIGSSGGGIVGSPYASSRVLVQ